MVFWVFFVCLQEECFHGASTEHIEAEAFSESTAFGDKVVIRVIGE